MMSRNNEEYIRKNKVVLIDDDKNTRLHYASALGNLKEVEKIVASGHRLDPENYLGWTPLMMAVRNGQSSIVDVLIASGADSSKENRFGMNLLLLSVTSGNLSIVEKILEHLLCGGISRRILQRQLSPISLAILFGHNHIFQYLLGRSFDVNAATPLTGMTPMMFAAAVGNNKAIKKLLQYKADVSLRNALGKTAQDLLELSRQKMGIEVLSEGPKTPQLPVIVVTPQSDLQLAPYVLSQPVRRSSNVKTPNMLVTPGVTPIPPHMLQQVFFGPEFSPSQLINSFADQCSLSFSNVLNANISPSGFLTPSPQMCYPTYM